MYPLTLLRRATRRFGFMIHLQPSNRPYTVRNEANEHQRKSSGQPLARVAGHPRHIISSLSPDHITPNDYVDPSSRRSFTIRFPGSAGKGTELHFHWADTLRSENTAGFLYYHRHPRAAPMEGSIRLRVTPNNAPSSFSNGQDLCLPSGLRWQIIVPQIALRHDLAPIRDQLLHEDLVTPEQLSRCRRVFAKSGPIHSQTTLFCLDQEFPVKFSTVQYLTVAGERLHKFYISPFKARVNGGMALPWTGSAIVRFEPSLLSQHGGRRRGLHLRIVKLLTSVSPAIEGYRGRIFKPEESQLLTVSNRGGPPEPWRYDIEQHKTTAAAALRHLWNISSSESSDHSLLATGEHPPLAGSSDPQS
ncbi:hypothetical protein DFH06DRAFT_214545 [Mycena polygramma]|nr:hypothetical protein DFH06DRAFT_214545 [Mycena polygramma]